MLTVGLTGGIGSGKTTVANLFAARGICLVDADLLSREPVQKGQPALTAIAEHFGVDILLANGELDRALLREIIFQEPAEKDWLEQLLHPLINQLIQQRLQQCQSPYRILVSPLLLETSQHKLVDRVLVVNVSPQTQIERTMARDGSSRATIKAIIASQIDQQSRLQKADDVVDNDGGPELLPDQVEKLHQLYLQLA